MECFFCRNHEHHSPEGRTGKKAWKTSQGLVGSLRLTALPNQTQPTGSVFPSAAFSAWDNMVGYGVLASTDCNCPSQTQLASGESLHNNENWQAIPGLHSSQKKCSFLLDVCVHAHAHTCARVSARACTYKFRVMFSFSQIRQQLPCSLLL